MHDWDGARARWDSDFGVAHRRARAANAALLVTAGVEVYGILVMAWQIVLLGQIDSGEVSMATRSLSDSLLEAWRFAEIAMRVITGALFLRWLWHTVPLAGSMSASRLRWTSRDALLSFFIPLFNFVRPYQLMRDLHDHLSPDGVPEPAPRPRMDGAGGYRHVAMEKAPPPRALPHASIGAWWALFLLPQLLSRMVTPVRTNTVAEVITNRYWAIAVCLATIGGAILAVMMVRTVQSRFAERYRRVRHASDEELESWMIQG
ncbi:hypothetical protein BE17_01195 [Sorangium cellulosum]|uniref:DUF4328 domain-containing protein n=1 Tax=Sorangium cellulosum TaxID=56 RepID=A0A150SK49_SORCE|nr:hypothetical protein BE17_01195 [Sorangium cellulosum]